MKITIIAIGKCKNSSQIDLLSSYLKRIPWKTSLIQLETKKSQNNEELKQYEEKLLMGAVPKNAKIIVLDEKGENFDSNGLANVVKRLQNSGDSNIAFIIGGAYGLSENLKNNADYKIAFGKQTWPHMLVRIMLAEQIYRVYTIISGHPYHKE